jgi:hypothetical protein
MAWAGAGISRKLASIFPLPVLAASLILVIELGSASFKHADIVASVIIRLGGKPNWSFEPFPAKVDLVSIFQTQLGKEQTTLEFHIKTVQIILKRLSR